MLKRTSVGFGFYHASRDEPPIENRKFLRSYLSYGAWLRCVSARRQLEILAGAKDQTIERLAATANFYQQIAMQTEDICASLIAMVVLKENKALRLPNILKRISLTASKGAGGPSAEDCIAQLANSEKTVKVDVSGFFGYLASHDPIKLMGVFGLDWSKRPSVKTVPRKLERRWLALPDHIHQLCHSITDRGSTYLTKTFNKIKHGPQLDVVDYFEVLRKLSASSGDQAEESIESLIDRLRSNGNYPETIRVLYDGANVSARDDQSASCLFLEDNPSDLRFFFHESQFPMSVVTWSLLSFIYVQEFHEKHIDMPSEVATLYEEYARVLEKSRSARLRKH